MATSSSSSTPRFGLVFSGFLVTLFVTVFCSDKSYAVREEASAHLHHTIQISSLLPSTVCTPPTKGQRQRRSASSLKLVDRHGPCSPVRIKTPTITEFLKRDQSRVNSIQSRIRSKTGVQDSDSAVTIPAKSGILLGTANYLVTVGLGTPKKDLSLLIDTSSDISWTQCQPCVRSCYKQQETIFDPSASTSYKNISCNTDTCSNVASTTRNTQLCSGPICLYSLRYNDQSFSIGDVSTDTLTLGSDVFQNFQFGCGQNNQGHFGRAAGIIGLARDPLSLISQTSSKYGKYFSYCLSSSSSSTGYLTLGKGASSAALKFTPISINPNAPSFYFIDIEAIAVGGITLPISPSVFTAGGTIIDSGTVITRLPPEAYTALRTAFRQQMPAKYPLTYGASILDTCYDLTNFTELLLPQISFTFGGNTVVKIPTIGILYAVNYPSQICFAFAGNTYAFDQGIFGNMQQKTLEVVYDVAGGKLGFGTGGCS